MRFLVTLFPSLLTAYIRIIDQAQRVVSFENEARAWEYLKRGRRESEAMEPNNTIVDEIVKCLRDWCAKAGLFKASDRRIHYIIQDRLDKLRVTWTQRDCCWIYRVLPDNYADDGYAKERHREGERDRKRFSHKFLNDYIAIYQMSDKLLSEFVLENDTIKMLT